MTNEDDAAHTVTATEEGDFDVTIQGGETATFKAPSEPGSYPSCAPARTECEWRSSLLR